MTATSLLTGGRGIPRLLRPRSPASAETPNALVQISCQVTDVRLLSVPAAPPRRRTSQLTNTTGEHDGSAPEMHVHNATALHAAA